MEDDVHKRYVHFVRSRSKKGRLNPQWKGGKALQGGYILIKDWTHPRRHSNGYVLEHIVVLEKKLGRPLAHNEVAHHINGNKTDNRPDNLEVMNRAYHITHHHTNAKFVNHSDTICTICGRSRTKMNIRRNGTKYPLWLYASGHKHDKNYVMCQTCWTRERRRLKH